MGVNITSYKYNAPVIAIDKNERISSWFQQLVAEKTGGAITKDLTPFQIRAKIYSIEEQLKKEVEEGNIKDQNEEYVINHIFTEGVYCREMHIPAGHLVVGKLHKHPLINFISKGRVTVITEQNGVEEYVAPCTFVSPAGTKRLLFTHEDTIWSGIHPTHETDLSKIEDEFIAKSYDELGWEQPTLIENKEKV